jgi:CHAD domain-containing protein
VLDQAAPAYPAATRNLDTLDGLVGAYLDAQHSALLRAETHLPHDPDAVHASRVATRRYRSVLRVLEPAFHRGTAGRLERELAWFGRALGEVRDHQVLRVHLDELLAELAPQLAGTPVRDHIHRTLDAELAVAAAEVRILLRSRRYSDLLTQLSGWHYELPIAAGIPAAVVGDYLSRAEREVRRRQRDVPAGNGRDDALHRVRKAAKRTRYVAELSRPELGERARSAMQLHEEQQTRLGRRQDGVVAAAFLDRIAADAATAGENTAGYQLLAERARTRDS